ncbi:hypothetical protein BLL52_2527 [Rhodoferax antarcticus ANT.BR]|uniref:Uncharacterized protein n=1 Tax=Rhodoferax antarcticus ANT.BR TaxID=1111071 RepID=A0A1Q8YE17_9BURK|nr:hypothetical protein BLL52_2527 [Rhodoferax antarcticus ANT.BR]
MNAMLLADLTHSRPLAFTVTHYLLPMRQKKAAAQCPRRSSQRPPVTLNLVCFL